MEGWGQAGSEGWHGLGRGEGGWENNASEYVMVGDGAGSRGRAIVGFKVDDLISIRQAIQNLIQEKFLSEVKREKVNHR